MKTLFLDFDGVLHDKAATEQPGLLRFETIMAERDCFIFVDHLVRLLDGHEVDIIVHSGWRLGGQFTHDELRGFLRNLGDRFKGTTVIFDRYESIRYYIAEHGISDYRILDDAHAEFPEDLPELIACHPSRGVSDPDVQAQLMEWLQS